MKKILVLAAFALAALGGCGELLAPAAAVVHDHKITIDEVQSAVDEFRATREFKQLAAQGDGGSILRQFEQNYLSQLIRREILQREAEARGISFEQAEIDARVDEIKGDFPTEEAFEEALRGQGITLEQLVDLVHDQMIEDAIRTDVVADVGPSEEEMLQFYRDNEGDYRQTRASHILVAERALAQRLSSELAGLKGKALARRFAQLARENSQDTSNAKDGGDLGYFSAGDFVEPFEKAADALDIGEVSPPVRSEFGFHIIMVTDRRTRSFDEVREEIRQELAGAEQDEAWQVWLLDAFTEAEIEVNTRYGEFDLATQRVIDVDAASIPGAAVPSQEPAETEAGD